MIRLLPGHRPSGSEAGRREGRRSSRTVPRLLAVLALTLPCRGERGPGPSYLVGGERILFFGDSITEVGHYITYVEAFLRTRFPGERFTLINHGINSETISDRGESGKHALKRFSRDVAAWKPDVVVACYGMNDGQYHPFDEERFARFQAGIRTLMRRTRDETGARLTLLTPPPFDPYRRTVHNPDAVQFGYAFPAIDYDRTLERYAAWLTTLRAEGVVVADVHSALNALLAERRRTRVSAFLADDGIHPSPTGHWLMAQALLLSWHMPASCAEARIDAARLASEAGDIRDLRRERDEIHATWRTPLPLPLDPAWDPHFLADAQVSARLNQYRLTVSGLTAPRYRLLVRLARGGEEALVASPSREQLATGLDLAGLPHFPTVALGREVLALLHRDRKEAYNRWREVIAADERGTTAHRAVRVDGSASEKVRRLCQPHDLILRLVPDSDP